jgi:integrase
MARYQKTKFTLGDWYLTQRSGSAAWYRATIETGKIRRVSLQTADYEEARRRFERWWAENYKLDVQDMPPSKVKLADVLNHYECNHVPKVASAQSIKIILRYWREYWGDATVADVRPLEKQEAFRAHLLALGGMGHVSVARCMEIGKAAIRYAWKRGLINAVPYIEIPTYGETPPKGRPLTVEEIGRLLRGTAEPHLQLFILLMLGTAARPGALFDLTWGQIDWQAGLIRLNPEGRKQTAKRRPVVKLPDTLKAVLEPLKGAPDAHVLQFRGKPIRKVDSGWHKMVKRAGLEGNVTPYSCRHTVARWLRQQGVPLEEVAGQLGHVMPGFSMTLRYSPDAPDYLQRAEAALDKLLALVVNSATTLERGGINQETAKESYG